MKTAILLVACALLSLNFTSSDQQKTFTLHEILKSPKFDVSVSSNGEYNGKSVVLTIKSNTTDDVFLKVPEGTLFFPSNEDEQTLVAPRKQTLLVKKNKINNLTLYGFCTEESDKCPSEEGEFKIDKNKNEELKKLLIFFKENKGINKQNVQEAIWCITDGASISNINCEDKALNKKLKKKLSEITKRQIPWHTNKRKLETNDRGYIVATPVEVLGKITFSTTKKTTVKSKIINEEGIVVFPNDNDMIIPKAIKNITLDFKVKVTGWEKGKYFVLYYTEQGKTILKKEFSI